MSSIHYLYCTWLYEWICILNSKYCTLLLYPINHTQALQFFEIKYVERLRILNDHVANLWCQYGVDTYAAHVVYVMSLCFYCSTYQKPPFSHRITHPYHPTPPKRCCFTICRAVASDMSPSQWNGHLIPLKDGMMGWIATFRDIILTKPSWNRGFLQRFLRFRIAT